VKAEISKKKHHGQLTEEERSEKNKRTKVRQVTRAGKKTLGDGGQRKSITKEKA